MTNCPSCISFNRECHPDPEDYNEPCEAYVEWQLGEIEIIGPDGQAMLQEDAQAFLSQLQSGVMYLGQSR